MVDERLVITETGFLTEFLNQHDQLTDRPFCFLLGAGVSKPSGIPTGGEMAAVWLKEMYDAENFNGLGLEAWATPERLEIPHFAIDKLSRFYPELYRRRYSDHEQAGYAFLESQMEGKEPSYGYSVLAYLLSETPHRVVVTTNFDNLVADGLSIHSSRFPLVVGHDALAQYAAVELRRPLVAKIHGALGFAPKSQPDDIADLPESWRIALRRIFERYTPIVIGYEGNDGSLMRFLQTLPEHIPDRVLWCVFAPDAKPKECLDRVSPEVLQYVRTRHGRFIPIRGFDELMAKLLSKLRERGSVPDLYERLKERARERERNYDEQQRMLFEAAVPTRRPEDDKARPVSSNADRALTEAVSEIAESRKEKPWWVWSQEADAEPDVNAKESVFQAALKALPESPDLMKSYAFFLEQVREDIDGAEKFYERALELNPKHAQSLAFYADFLERYRNNPEKAEGYYQRSLEVDPKRPYTLIEYADLLETFRKDMDGAETLYLRAVEADPTYAHGLRAYASFLARVRKNAAKADEYFARAVKADPENVYALTSYARFLRSQPGKEAQADELDQRAQKLKKGSG